jgi:hypothetical protein
VGHRHKFEATVEDAEDLVAAEVQLLHVALDLHVAGRVAEAQIAVALVQRTQVRQDARPVPRRQRADRNPAEAERRLR